MRLIDADALIEFWKADFTEEERSKLHIPLNVAIKNLRDAPTVDAVERKRGRWIPVDSYSAFGGDEEAWEVQGNPIAFYYCSECKEQTYAGENGESLTTDFCPFCGADMRGENNG